MNLGNIHMISTEVSLYGAQVSSLIGWVTVFSLVISLFLVGVISVLWYWSRVGSACSGLEPVLGSQPETGAGLGQWKHEILVSRPVVSDKSLALWLYRKAFPQRWKIVNRIKCVLRGKKVQYMWIDTGADLEGESLRCTLMASRLNHLYRVFFSGYPLANHSDLPGSQSIFGLSQDPSMCEYTSLSQDKFYCKGIWVERPLT